jgi:DUF4097 and DUF4098 domain-containing protein YvlB
MRIAAHTRLVKNAVAAFMGLMGLAACGFGGVEGKSEWTKTYTLAEGGALEIQATNGEIDITPSDGSTVTVVAEKIARASTEAAAKEAAAAIPIKESISPTRIALDARTEGTFGGGSREVKFHVKAPAWAAVTIKTTNSEVSVHNITGDLHVEATNGEIHGDGLAGSTSVETTNGEIVLDYATMPAHGITCSATNGEITVTIPKDSNARIAADVTNGGISTENLTLHDTKDSRRSLEATLNAGGPSIKIETTNGGIKIRGR